MKMHPLVNGLAGAALLITKLSGLHDRADVDASDLVIFASAAPSSELLVTTRSLASTSARSCG